MNNSNGLFCPKCGQAVPSNTQFCPHCGAPLSAPQPQATPNASHQTTIDPNQDVKRPLNRLALLGLIIGLISWFLNFWGIVGIAAVILSVLALNQSLTHREKVIAIVGLASGAFNILYALAAMSY